MNRTNLEGCVIYITHNSITEGSSDIGDIPTLGIVDTNVVLCTPESLREVGYEIPFPNRGFGGRLVWENVIEADSPLTILEPNPFMYYFTFWMERGDIHSHRGAFKGSVGSGLHLNCLGYIDPKSKVRYDFLSTRIEGGVNRLQMELKRFVDEGIPITDTGLYNYFRERHR